MLVCVVVVSFLLDLFVMVFIFHLLSVRHKLNFLPTSFSFSKPPYAGAQVQRKKCEGKKNFFEREEFQMKFYSEKLNKLFDT